MNTTPAAAPAASVEMERAVLSAAMKDSTAVVAVMCDLREPDFYYDAHRKIHAAMRRLFESGHAVDLSSIAEELRKRGELDASFGDAGLLDIYRSTPTTAHVEYHVAEVRKWALRRAAMRAASDFLDRVHDTSEEPDAVLREMSGELAELLADREAGTFKPIKSLVGPWFDELEARRTTGDAPGIPIGYPLIDSRRGGFRIGEQVIVAARPSVGKSLFGGTVALNVAQRGIGVAVISLEMSASQYLSRIVARLSGVSQNDLYRPMEREQHSQISGAVNRMYGLPLWIWDRRGLSIPEITAGVEVLKRQHPELKLVVVDYMQLIRPLGRGNRNDQLGEISAGLFSLWGRTGTVGITLSQLNRDSEREQRPPEMRDLRDSGNIEQDADVILFLYEKDGHVFGVCRKDRNGPLVAARQWELNRDGALALLEEAATGDRSLPPVASDDVGW